MEPPGNPEHDAWDAAYDLLTGEGVPPERAALLALAARDPVAFAEKYVRLRRALRESGFSGR